MRAYVAAAGDLDFVVNGGDNWFLYRLSLPLDTAVRYARDTYSSELLTVLSEVGDTLPIDAWVARDGRLPRIAYQLKAKSGGEKFALLGA